MRSRIVFWLFFAALALLLFAKLGDRALAETSEARYAETAREMYRSGDWITPRFFGLKHFHKPPFTYWMAEAGYALFGVNELGARFFLAMAALATLALTFRLGRLWFGRRTAYLATAVLGTSPLFTSFARVLTTDMVLTLCTTAAVWGFAEARAGWARGYTAMWAALGAAFLVKGPVGIPIVAFPIVALLGWRSQKGRWRQLFAPQGLLVFAAVALPWYVAVCVRNPGLFRQLVVFETVQRLTTTVHGRPGPIYYFLPVFLVGFFPWSLLVPAATVRLWRRVFGPPCDSAGAPLFFSFWWFVASFVMFSLSGSKLPAYILPLFPAASLFLGVWLEELAAGERPTRLATATAIVGSLVAAAAIAFTELVIRPEATQGLRANLLVLVPALGLWAWAAHRTERTGRGAPLVAGAAAAALVFPALVAPFCDRVSGEFKSMKPLTDAIRAAAGPNDPVVLCRIAAGSVPFYLERPVYTFECDHDFKFEDDPASARRRHFYDLGRIGEMLRRGRVFLIAGDETARRLELEAASAAGAELRTLARAWKYRLLTNAGAGTRGASETGTKTDGRPVRAAVPR